MEIKRGYVYTPEGKKPLYLFPDLLESASEKQKLYAAELAAANGYNPQPELLLDVTQDDY